jgi:hypothetical protein
MGIPSLLVFAVVGIAWGMMPTDPSRYRRHRLGVITVSAAGPALNLLLAVLCLGGAGVWLWAAVTGAVDVSDTTRVNVFQFLYTGGWLNIVLAAFNMLPVPPLDGSRVLGGIFPPLERFFMQPGIQAYGMIVVLILFFTSAWRPLLDGASRESLLVIGRVAHALPDSGERQTRNDSLDLLFALTSPEFRELMRAKAGSAPEGWSGPGAAEGGTGDGVDAPLPPDARGAEPDAPRR